MPNVGSVRTYQSCLIRIWALENTSELAHFKKKRPCLALASGAALQGQIRWIWCCCFEFWMPKISENTKKFHWQEQKLFSLYESHQGAQQTPGIHLETHFELTSSVPESKVWTCYIYITTYGLYMCISVHVLLCGVLDSFTKRLPGCCNQLWQKCKCLLF